MKEQKYNYYKNLSFQPKYDCDYKLKLYEKNLFLAQKLYSPNYDMSNINKKKTI